MEKESVTKVSNTGAEAGSNNESQKKQEWRIDIDPERDYGFLLTFAKNKFPERKFSENYNNDDLIDLLDLTEVFIREHTLPKLGEKFDVVNKIMTMHYGKPNEYGFTDFRDCYRVDGGEGSDEQCIKLGLIEVVGEFLGTMELALCNNRVKPNKRRRQILIAMVDMISEDTGVPIDKRVLWFADGLAFNRLRMFCGLNKNCLFPRENTFPPGGKLD
jgi:hypothetical protein